MNVASWGYPYLNDNSDNSILSLTMSLSALTDCITSRKTCLKVKAAVMGAFDFAGVTFVLPSSSTS